MTRRSDDEAFGETAMTESLRTVDEVITAHRTLEGAGFEVRRPFPRPGRDLIDPFLLLDEMGPVDLGPGQAKGAPDHPHRGFETVTYVLAGAIEHADSAGNRGSIGPGDVQWMTAGAGVVHSEEPAAAIRQLGGRLHGFQLWVNLPRADKWTPPRYQEISTVDIPEVALDGGVARVVAGTFAGATGPVRTHSPVSYLHLTLQPGAQAGVPIDPGHTAMAYVFGGSGTFPDPAVDGQLVVWHRHSGDAVAIGADDGEAPLEVLVLAGAPLGEPVARHGPFVMSTRAEIIEAVEDYQAGRLGRIAR